jgi:hypothetical protein
MRHSIQWSKYQNEAGVIRNFYHDLIQQGWYPSYDKKHLINWDSKSTEKSIDIQLSIQEVSPLMTKIHSLEKKLSVLESSLVSEDEVTASQIQSLVAEMNGIKKHERIKPVAIEILRSRLNIAKMKHSRVKKR